MYKYFGRFNLVLITFYCLTSICSSFNLGTGAGMRVVHRGTKNTMFGYDVAMHKNGPEEYTLLVGAPRANSGQPDVIRGGAVYKCSSLSSRCTVQYFDRKGHTEELHGSKMIQTGSKSDQWFGATVVALDTDDPNNDAVIACAPHYLYYGTKNEFKEPTGNCFYANQSFRNIKEFSPCKLKMKHGFHRLGFCMAGFSASIGHDYHAYLGAPGAYYWGGALLSVQTSFERHRRPHYTQNGSKEYDDQFMGYSTAVGDFDGDQIDDVAVGIPRGNNLTGQVNLYDENLRNIQNITGDQLGSYFGASLAVTDLNGDGLHDIIVGAPLYTKVEKSSAGVRSTYELGRVYVYLQGRRHQFDQAVPINGHKEWSRFGFDVAAAGDLNQDGYNDFIVGAPYDGMDRRSGAIYIYNGAKNGVRDKYSQVIYGQSVQAAIETFGFSVTGGRDVDNNGYPDILVGAYKSDIAVLFKSRPVLNMQGKINLRSPVIKLDQKECVIKDRSSSRRQDQRVACVKMDICTTYSGKRLSPDLDLKFLITLDASKPREPRARFLGHGGSSMTVETVMIANEQHCEPAEIYVEEGIIDKLSPIVIHVNYTVIEDRYKRDALVPIVSTLDDGFLKEELKIWRDCGIDDECIPDLQILTAHLSRTTLPAGADQRFDLSLNVKNRLDPAYEAYLYVYTPKGMDREKSVDLKNRTFTCDDQAASSEINGYDVSRCNLGNPMPARSTFNLALTFGTRSFEGPYEKVPLYIKINSTNNETGGTLGDNNRTVEISFSLDADFEVFAGNNSYVYDVSTARDPATFSWDEDIGPLVNHTYELVNTRNTTLAEILVDIYFPSHTYDGQPLLYIIDNLILGANQEQTQCQLYQKGNINPNHYGISKRAPQKARLLKRQVPEFVHQSEKQPRSFLRFLSTLKEKASYFKIRGMLSQRKYNCFEMNCTQWRCTVKNFREGSRLRITVESRLWTNTLINEGFYGTTISSVIIAQVSKLSHKAPAGIDLPVKYAIATTTVTASDPSRVRRGIPWWLILIAVLAGLALLVLLILLLWRCGFFKRKRPPRGQALLAKPSEAEFYGYSTYSAANPNYPTHGTQPYGQRL